MGGVFSGFGGGVKWLADEGFDGARWELEVGKRIRPRPHKFAFPGRQIPVHYTVMPPEPPRLPPSPPNPAEPRPAKALWWFYILSVVLTPLLMLFPMLQNESEVAILILGAGVVVSFVAAVFLGMRLSERRIAIGLSAGRGWIVPLLVIAGWFTMGGVFFVGCVSAIVPNLR